jgi:predicted AAA+ superfamily ATPase
MKRLVHKDLVEWKNSPQRKPLILYGARQVGKTWLLKEFRQSDFKRTFYINFDTDRKIHSLFGDDISPQTIIRGLENYFNEKITPQDTLLIFDEIQECQRAKDSLKYFNEEAPQYHIAAAGSFLGIAGGKFPVGQVNEITLYPLSFSEFLEAAERGLLAETLQERNIAQIAASHEMLVEKLKEFLFCGGMPEAVKTFAETGSFIEVRRVQEVILNNYKNDFSKHISAVNIPKVRMLWDSIPAHLAKEKKKFVYKEIKTGGRASEFENAMNWLVSTGLVYKINRTSTPKTPLSAYEEREHFKLYTLDAGLLCAKAGLDASAFMSGDKTIFTEFKGALAEQFVLQELKVSGGSPLLYWGNESGKAEVDFIMQHKNEIIPIEVKSSVNTKSQSLSVYMEKYHPDHAVRISLKNFGIAKGLFSVPLYLIGSLENLPTDKKS